MSIISLVTSKVCQIFILAALSTTVICPSLWAAGTPPVNAAPKNLPVNEGQKDVNVYSYVEFLPGTAFIADAYAFVPGRGDFAMGFLDGTPCLKAAVNSKCYSYEELPIGSQICVAVMSVPRIENYFRVVKDVSKEGGGTIYFWGASVNPKFSFADDVIVYDHHWIGVSVYRPCQGWT